MIDEEEAKATITNTISMIKNVEMYDVYISQFCGIACDTESIQT